MKKMNLKFFNIGAKMVLPLFMLFMLFLTSATTVKAQFIDRTEVLPAVRKALDSPEINIDMLLKQNASQSVINIAKAKKEAMFIVSGKVKKGATVEDAFNSVFTDSMISATRSGNYPAQGPVRDFVYNVFTQ